METAEKLTKLYEMERAVDAADDAWFEALKAGGNGKAEKAVRKAAYDAFRTYEAELLDAHTTVTCGRCGGEGMVSWGVTVVKVDLHGGQHPAPWCFDCGGAKVVPLRKHKFGTQAPTRLKHVREHEAKEAAETAARDAKWTAFASEYPAVAAYLAPHVYPEGERYDAEYDDFLCSLRLSVVRFGSLTEKQMAAVERSMDRAAAKVEAAAKVAEAGPLVGGKRSVEGEIVSTKWVDGYGGSRQHKALIALDSGHRIFGTVSEKFWDGVHTLSREIGLEDGVDLSVEGLRVRFTCEIERKGDDFGFYKRPSKVEILGHKDAEETKATLAAAAS